MIQNNLSRRLFFNSVSFETRLESPFSVSQIGPRLRTQASETPLRAKNTFGGANEYKLGSLGVSSWGPKEDMQRLLRVPGRMQM